LAPHRHGTAAHSTQRRSESVSERAIVCVRAVRCACGLRTARVEVRTRICCVSQAIVVIERKLSPAANVLLREEACQSVKQSVRQTVSRTQRQTNRQTDRQTVAQLSLIATAQRAAEMGVRGCGSGYTYGIGMGGLFRCGSALRGGWGRTSD
jgi:hypothetical protein